MSLRARLLALVLLAMSAPAALVGLRFAQDRAGAVEAARTELSELADTVAGDLDQKVQGTSQLLHGLARARDLDTRDRPACSAFLASVLEEYPRYTGLLTIDPDGRLFCDSLQTGRALDLRDREYFHAAQQRPGVALQPAFGRLTGTSVLQIAHAARQPDGAVKFVLLASFNLQSFATEHLGRLPNGGELLLVDRAGTLMARAAAADSRTKPGERIAESELFRFAASLGDAGVGEAPGLDGRLEVWGVAASPAARDAGLRVLVGAPKDELVAAADRRFAQDMAILAAVSLLLFAGVWTLAELGVRRQVGRISAMAARLGQGELGARIPPPHPRGELGDLMSVLNGAAESLERQRAAIDELDRRLRQAQKMEALGQLTGGMAHDFNNLLTVIVGNSEYLSEALAKDPGLRRFADLSLSAAERGADLTKSLLAFARRQPLEPKTVDVGGQMRDMETLLRRTLGEQIECSFLLARDVWPATVDPAQLESAVLNLALNARDAMPRGGRLTVEVANARLDEGYADRNDEVRPGEYVMVAVSDTGSGMTPDVAARAFEPFFTTKDVGKGSGMGLSMVYGFAKQSGGLAKIYSEPGHGTAVKLYLPRADAAASGAERQGGRESAPGGGEAILAVEDDDMVRAYVERELESLGYRVVLASNAEAALAVLRGSQPVDLLFTDIVMPGGMLGPQLAEEALRLRPGLKVVFTSGYSENGVSRNGRVGPAAPLLSKPYRRHDLARVLRAALKS